MKKGFTLIELLVVLPLLEFWLELFWFLWVEREAKPGMPNASLI